MLTTPEGAALVFHVDEISGSGSAGVPPPGLSAHAVVAVSPTANANTNLVILIFNTPLGNAVPYANGRAEPSARERQTDRGDTGNPEWEIRSRTQQSFVQI